MDKYDTEPDEMPLDDLPESERMKEQIRRRLIEAIAFRAYIEPNDESKEDCDLDD